MVQDKSTVGFGESESKSEYIKAHYLITAPVGANKLICELFTIWLEFLNLFRIMLFFDMYYCSYLVPSYCGS